MKTRRKRNTRIDPKLIQKIVERARKLKIDPEVIETIRNLNQTLTKLSEQQLRFLSQRITPRRPRRPVRSGRTILYSGKLDQIWGTPLGAAKWLAEEIRANPSVGWRLVEQERKLRRNVKGYLPKMMRKLGEYLEDEQAVFDQVDYKIIDIVEQHPDYTIKEITAALSEDFPKRKWAALTRRVQRLLENVPGY
jgi:hypothetical protein